MKTFSTTSGWRSTGAGPTLKLLGVFAAGLLLTPSPAAGYQCALVGGADTDPTRPSLSWFQRTIPLTLHQDGTGDIANDEEFTLLATALSVWSHAQGCQPPHAQTDLRFDLQGEHSTSAAIGFHFGPDAINENLLRFHDQQWPHPGQRDFVYGITTTTYNWVSGALLDADIEFNTADFTFSSAPGDDDVDLISVAVHELGHVLGLDHSQVQGATMAASYTPGDLNKRTLHCDDHDGITFKYPAGEQNGYCDPDDPPCKHCSPPRHLSHTPTLQVVGQEPDSTGGACNAGLPPSMLGLVCLALICRRLRARSPRP